MPSLIIKSGDGGEVKQFKKRNAVSNLEGIGTSDLQWTGISKTTRTHLLVMCVY